MGATPAEIHGTTLNPLFALGRGGGEASSIGHQDMDHSLESIAKAYEFYRDFSQHEDCASLTFQYAMLLFACLRACISGDGSCHTQMHQFKQGTGGRSTGAGRGIEGAGRHLWSVAGCNKSQCQRQGRWKLQWHMILFSALLHILNAMLCVFAALCALDPAAQT